MILSRIISFCGNLKNSWSDLHIWLLLEWFIHLNFYKSINLITRCAFGSLQFVYIFACLRDDIFCKLYCEVSRKPGWHMHKCTILLQQPEINAIISVYPCYTCFIIWYVALFACWNHRIWTRWFETTPPALNKGHFKAPEIKVIHQTVTAMFPCGVFAGVGSLTQYLYQGQREPTVTPNTALHCRCRALTSSCHFVGMVRWAAIFPLVPNVSFKHFYYTNTELRGLMPVFQ